jgi:hypothetical protein
MQIDDKFPKSLLEATRYFADPDVCVDFVASNRLDFNVSNYLRYLKTIMKNNPH